MFLWVVDVAAGAGEPVVEAAWFVTGAVSGHGEWEKGYVVGGVEEHLQEKREAWYWSRNE